MPNRKEWAKDTNVGIISIKDGIYITTRNGCDHLERWGKMEDRRFSEPRLKKF